MNALLSLSFALMILAVVLEVSIKLEVIRFAILFPAYVEFRIGDVLLDKMEREEGGNGNLLKLLQL